MLSFHNVSFTYPGDIGPIAENLSFSVCRGDFVSIIGASGCGKSTIFRLINGLEKPQQGSITIDGTPIEQLHNYSSFMPQKDLLFPWHNVRKNVSLPMELAGIPKAERDARCLEVLQNAGLAEYIDKMPHELSGGMRQRVSFARTLLAGADMLLLDEPFSALDYLTKIEMQEWLLRQWEHYHKTILFITHDVEEAIFLSKKVFIIRSVPFGTMEEITVPLDYPRHRKDLAKPEIIALREHIFKRLRREAGQ